MESLHPNPSIERLGERASLENELLEAEPPNTNTSRSPPLSDGGLQGWLQCLGAFFMFFNSWGIVNTFGSGNPSQLDFALLMNHVEQECIKHTTNKTFFVMSPHQEYHGSVPCKPFSSFLAKS